jgi:hypothetical protein
MDKLRVFITKVVINWESDQSTIDNRVDLSIIIDSPRNIVVDKLGQGMRSSKFTIHDLYAGGCQWQWQVCQWHNGKCVYVSVSVCVCVIPLGLFQVEYRVLVYHTSRQSRWCPEWTETSDRFPTPDAGSCWHFCLLHPLPHCLSHSLSTFPVSQQSASLSRCLFTSCSGLFPSFFEDFFSWPSFLVREDLNLCRCVMLYVSRILTSTDVYCCTYREDTGNRLPLCEDEVDFILSSSKSYLLSTIEKSSLLSIVDW